MSKISTLDRQFTVWSRFNLTVVSLFIALMSGQAASAQAVIGIFGDLHGDQAIAMSVLQQMRQRGVTHIIGTGDFVRFEGPELLQTILSKITPTTGVPKQNVFLFPGNWEHETGFAPETMNTVIEQFGTLVFENYDGYGFVKVSGEKIMVSHFPQHEVPDDFLPPPQFRRRMNGQAYVMDTVQRGIRPTDDVTFEIFAHTHVGGAFWESDSGKLVVNAGVLDMRTKAPNEPRAYAIYSQADHNVRFYNADTKVEIARVNVSAAASDRGNACQLLLRDHAVKP